MKEFTVQLFDNGSAKISGTGANLELRFGYSKNAHIYSVKFIRSKEWEDLYIRVHFHPEADIYDVEPVLAQNNIVNIPAMITSMPGEGKLTIEGTDGYKIITSADIPYRVSENSGIDSDTDPEPGESSFQQFVDAVKEDAKSAEQAAKDAESALTETKEASASALTDIEKAKGNAISEIEKIETEVKSEIQEDVDSAKSSAEASSKSAEEAKTAADSAKKSLSDLETAKDSALSDISKEKDTSVSAVGSAKESALTELSKSASSAIQNVKMAETNAINSVETEGSTQKTALNNASNAALTSIDTAKTNAVKAVEDKASEESSAIDQKSNEVIQDIQNAGDSELSAISEATSSAIEQITQSAGHHLTQIDSAADEAVTDILNAKEDSLEEIEGVNAHPPIQNPETGKWQTWNAETSSYVDTAYDWEGGYYSPSVDSEGNLTWEGSKEGMEDIPSTNIRGPQGLGVPTSTANDYGKAPTVNASGTGYELIGPYAPLSAAITETAKGNPAVCEDSVEWPLLGLKVYGKSTQVTTTGAQLIDTQAWQTADSAYYKVAEDGGMIQLKGDDRNATTIPAFLELEAGDYMASIDAGFILQVIKDGADLVVASGGNSTTFTLDAPATLAMKVYESPATNNYPSPVAYPMINAGSTVKPWEPYTGGKPSPSPEYPQEIVSAGNGGSTELNITGANLLSLPDRSGTEVGINFEIKNGVVKTDGINTSGPISLWGGYVNTSPVFYLGPGKYSFSKEFTMRSFDGSTRTWFSKTFNLDKVTAITDVAIITNNSINGYLYPMLNFGESVLPWEPYKSQSLTISTPNGLPGIHVDSGGNYTDADGQRRWSDIIDYSNEKKYQYINEVVVDGTNVKFTAGIDRQHWNLPNYSSPSIWKILKTQINKYFPNNVFAANEEYDFIFTVSSLMAPYFETIEELNAFCVQKNTEGNPLTIMYVMDTPIETPLSEEELAAYRVLHTYDSTTVITPDDALAEVEVDYIVKPKAYIEKKLTAIESRLNALEISEALEGE